MRESIMDKVKKLGASGLARTEFVEISISTTGMPPSTTGLDSDFDRFDTPAPAHTRRIGRVDRGPTKEGGQHAKNSKSTNVLSLPAPSW
ncbi:hypothetical protein [Polaromonas hydrogenivorans]|uniref:hypothetical protein n=1 Tax=Polaromonas hydrogenivorans TaxID=335476 RepID=UPI0039EFD006